MNVLEHLIWYGADQVKAQKIVKALIELYFVAYDHMAMDEHIEEAVLNVDKTVENDDA